MNFLRNRMRWHGGELVKVMQAETATHRLLRDRVVSLGLMTLVIDFVLSVPVWLAERRLPASQIVDYPDALFWTTSQLLSISSSMAAPLTGTGRWLDIVMEVWAITVVASLAGSLGSYFHRRGLERYPMNHEPPSSA